MRLVAKVFDLDDTYVVEVEVPGVNKGDVEITIGGRRLSVCGGRHTAGHRGILRHRTRHLGRFDYEVELPSDVEEESVTASLAAGVPTVRASRPTTDRRRPIEIE